MSEGRTQINEADIHAKSIVSSGISWERGGENTPVYVVLSAVAEASGCDVLELPPLNDAIDPEALDSLFTSRSNPAVDRVSFEYAGYEVVVRGSGEVRVRPTRES